jgi:hypothetical protein
MGLSNMSRGIQQQRKCCDQQRLPVRRWIRRLFCIVLSTSVWWQWRSDLLAIIKDHEIVAFPLPIQGARNSTHDEDHVAPSIARNSTRDAPSSIGARFPNGTLGYVADPYALQKGIHSFLGATDDDPEDRFWEGLVHYASRTAETTSRMSLSSDSVCAFGPGQGLEEEGGFKLLTEKIRIAPPTTTGKKIKILCALYTHNQRHDQARTAALTWGQNCDGFLAFSTETIPALGMVDLVHVGPEAYGNMWQKVRSIWAYIDKHYDDDFDFVHLSGDDTYVVVENLRHFLQQVQEKIGADEPVHLGQWIRQKNVPYIAGGPGYTINRAALKRFVHEALPTCHAEQTASYEDRLFSQCMQSIGIRPGDTRDVETGEQQYHDCAPHHLYTSRALVAGKRGSFHSRAAAYWETLPFPDRLDVDNLLSNAEKRNESVGPRDHLESAAVYSVALHNLFNPLYMTRVHAILYHTCPTVSPLGRGLRHYASNLLPPEG